MDNLKTKNKKGLEMSFAWMFALIVGAVILFLAIYASTKLIHSEQGVQDAKTSTEVGILLNPLETGFESVRAKSMTFPVETKIFNKCNTNSFFGRQLIQVSQKNFNKWSQTDLDVGFSNKYIFSKNDTQGKTFYLFSKSFEFPFKVANLIYLSSSEQEYCFIDAPEHIQEELLDVNQPNILVENCTDNSIEVCFQENCDINVDYNSENVVVDGRTLHFVGDALMYAAIFSEKDLYECQVKRLMMRVENLASLYRDKANFISRVGCDSNLNSDLLSLSNVAKNLESSANLRSVNLIAEDLGDKNDNGVCKLW